LEADADEFTAINWLPLDSTDWTAEHFDPHMARFVAKLVAALDPSSSGQTSGRGKSLGTHR